MRVLIPAILLGLLGVPAPVPRADDRPVLATIDALTVAGLKRDVAALDRLYAAAYFHTNPDGSVIERAAVLATYREPTRFTFTRSIRSDERVVVQRDFAVVNAVVTLHGKRDEDPFTSKYRITYVLQRNRRGWQVVNSHATLLAIAPEEERPASSSG